MGEESVRQWRSYIRKSASNNTIRTLAMMNHIRMFATGALGGALAGALIGLAEATLVVATTGPPEEFWLFPFGIFYYGLLGACVGAAIGLLAGLLVAPEQRAAVFGAGTAVALFPMAFGVARYHVVQRIYHEELVTLSATGLAVNAALLVAAIVLSAAMFFAVRGLGRRSFGVAAAAAGLVTCLVISAAAAASMSIDAGPQIVRSAPRGQGTNLVLVIADTLRADAFVERANRDPERSGISRLIADGVHFENAYAQASWTRPSIASILTSLYPSEHGATHKMDPLPEWVTTVAEALTEEGYWTAGIVTNINVAPIFNFQQGFGEYVYLEPDFYFGASDSATRLAIYKGLRVARERFFGSYMYYSNYYQDAAVVGRAVRDWLDAEPPEPFFLLVHYMDPHDPFFEMPYNGHGVARVSTPNPPAAEAAELKRLYDGGVAYFDEYLADLLGQLRSHDAYDDTIIALVADHGEEFQEHGGWWHGTTLYEEQVRVPLVVKRANESRPGTTEKQLVQTIDLVPTMMASAGLPIPEEFVGADLFGSASPGADETVFAEEDLEGNVLSTLIEGDWKVITANPGNPRGLQPLELYHLGDDPTESKDLAAERPEEVARMLHLLERQRRSMSR